MTYRSVESWRDAVPEICLPTPLESEPARTAYRHSAAPARPSSTLAELGYQPKEDQRFGSELGDMASEGHASDAIPLRNMPVISEQRPAASQRNEGPNNAGDATPQRPRRAYRSSFHAMSNRISLTPSEMPYPAAILYNGRQYLTAEEFLGLRRHGPDIAEGPLPVVLPSYRFRSSETLEPLNGRIAWLHACTAILAVFGCWGFCNAFGLFQAYYERYYLPDVSPSTIAWIGSTQLALVFMLGLPVGRLVDKGYFRMAFHGGSAVMILGIFCSSYCTQWGTLWLVQGLITGLGMGSVFCSGMVALMTWFDEKKMGAAMGLGAAGSCLGGIVYVLLARHFLASSGFGTTMRILSGFTLAIMIPPNIVFRMRRQQRRLSPRLSGAPTWSSLLSFLTTTFADPAYLLAAVGLFFSFLGLYFGFVYLPTYASTALHLSDTASTNLLIYMLLANLPGRFLPALISDRCIGPLNTLIPSALLSSAVLWLWTASSGSGSGPSSGALTVIACFYGFVSAGVQVLYAPATYTFCLPPPPPPPPGALAEPGTGLHPAEEQQRAADRMGVKAGGIFTCIGLACLIGTPVGGALIKHRTDRGLGSPFLGAQIFAAVSLLVGGCFLVASRVKKAGWEARRA